MSFELEMEHAEVINSGLGLEIRDVIEPGTELEEGDLVTVEEEDAMMLEPDDVLDVMFVEE